LKHTFSVAIIVSTESLLDKWNNVKMIAAQNVREKRKLVVNHYKNLNQKSTDSYFRHFWLQVIKLNIQL
jgi:hypothetical protein